MNAFAPSFFFSFENERQICQHLLLTTCKQTHYCTDDVGHLQTNGLFGDGKSANVSNTYRLIKRFDDVI